MYKFQFKNRDEPFDGIEEFVDNLSRGGEIGFVYNGKKYGIIRTEAGDLCFYGYYCEESEKLFSSIEELLECQIGEKKIKDIITLIQPFFRCF